MIPKNKSKMKQLDTIAVDRNLTVLKCGEQECKEEKPSTKN